MREPGVKPVGDAAAQSQHLHGRRAQHHVHAVPAQPCALVIGRHAQRADDAKPRALRRRCTRPRELEQDMLMQWPAVPTPNDGRFAHVEAADPRRLLHLDDRDPAGADERREPARIELLKAHAAPPPAGEH